MRVVVMLSAISLAGCGLAPLRFIDARADGAAADSADDGSVDAMTDGAMDGSVDVSLAEDVVVQTDSSEDGGSQTGPAGTPLGLCAGARAIGSTALGVRPSLPWSNTTLTGQRTVFQGHIEAGWTDLRIVVVDNGTDTVVYSERVPSSAGRIDHNPSAAVRFANGSYRWMLCAIDAGRQLKHSAEWRFRVSGTHVSMEGRAGMIPLLTDMTGDGYPELVVGAPSTANGGSLRGVARVFSYGSMGMVSGVQSSLAMAGASDDARTGYNVAMLGDVSGDGLADIAVASPTETVTGMLLAGRVQLYRGRMDRAAPTQMSSTLRGSAVNEGLGYVVAGLGDINGDGIDDFALGAPTALSDRGRVQLYLGAPSGGSVMLLQTIEGSRPSDAFGWSIAGVGDINGDGLNDIAIGALRGDATTTDAGSVSIWLGQRTGTLPMAPAQSIGPPATATMASDFGYAVSGAGDVNEDGYADLLVGSPNEGRAYLHLSNGTTLSTTPSPADFSGASVARYGRVLLGGLDLNADHHADLVIGAPNERAGEGAVYVRFGDGNGVFPNEAEIHGTTMVQNSTGLSLSVVGDLFWGRAQSAGCPTLLVGAPGNIALSDPGRVIAAHGDPIVGLDDMPAQREVNAVMGDIAFGASVGGPRAR